MEILTKKVIETIKKFPELEGAILDIVRVHEYRINDCNDDVRELMATIDIQLSLATEAIENLVGEYEDKIKRRGIVRVCKYTKDELISMAEIDQCDDDSRGWNYTDSCDRCGGVKSFLDWL